ncbi:MAG: hypothetical protein AAB681_01695 [Patescibacteria group bacterium]
MITNSIAYTYHSRGFSEELVKKREKEAFDFLFPKSKVNNKQYIEEKLNDILAIQAKVVIVPAKSQIIVINLADPEGIVSAINEALNQTNTTHESELCGWTEEGEIFYERKVIPERTKHPLTPDEIFCFKILFEGKSIQNIEDLLNIIWLPDHLKAKIIPAKKTVIIVDAKDPASIVTEANELLRGVNSGFYIKLVFRQSEKYPLMQVV